MNFDHRKEIVGAVLTVSSKGVVVHGTEVAGRGHYGSREDVVQEGAVTLYLKEDEQSSTLEPHTIPLDALSFRFKEGEEKLLLDFFPHSLPPRGYIYGSEEKIKAFMEKIEITIF